MKLILAIVASDAVDPVSKALVQKNFPVTHISSVGGFLRRGSTTLVIGVDETQVEPVLDTIRAATPRTASNEKAHAVTLFVLNAGQFVQI